MIDRLANGALVAVFIALCAALLVPTLSGCAKRAPLWEERRIPTTDAERAAVTEEMKRILSSTPQHLSGDDQDWDDTIAAAHKAALATHVMPTYWEYENLGHGVWKPTGRWRNAAEAK